MQLNQNRISTRGFSLAEVLVATGVTAVLLGGVFAGNTGVMRVLRSQKQTVAASHSIQERMEKLRSVGYSQVADPNYLKSTLLGADTSSQATLPSAIETITLTGYPPDGATPTQVVRQNGTSTITSINSNLPTAAIFRLDLSLVWTAYDGRQRTRQTSTLIGRGNLAP